MVLLLDYYAPVAPFCAEASGCAEVRASPLASLWGTVPLPVVGVLIFAFAFGVSMSANRKLVKLVLPSLSVVIACAGLGFFLAQLIWIGRFCVFCFVVDGASIALGISGLSLRRHGFFEKDTPRGPRDSLIDVDLSTIAPPANSVPGIWQDDSRLYEPPNPLVKPLPKAPLELTWLTWLTLASLSLLAPLGHVWLVSSSELPAEVESLYLPGQMNVVEFFDFECPHCQSLYPVLEEAKSSVEGHVNLMRRYVPFQRHPKARAASILAICAGEQGQEEAAVQRLFTGADFSESALLKVANSLTLDQGALQLCQTSERPVQRLAADRVLFDATKPVGLPTTYIGADVLRGSQSVATLQAALVQAKNGEGRRGFPALLYWALVSVSALSLGFFGRIRAVVKKVS